MTEQKGWRVVLVDDHQLVRAGLKLFIDNLSLFEVVAEASDGDEVLQMLAENHADILVTDVSMRRTSGLDIVPEVKAQFPGVRVLMLSMHNDKNTVRKALESGVDGYVVKDSSEAELQQALETVAVKRRYLSPEVAGDMLADLYAPPDDETRPALTERQQEILKLVALGRGTKEIAYELKLSSKTIESHRSQIMERLGIRDVATLARYAIRIGLIDLDEGF